MRSRFFVIQIKDQSASLERRVAHVTKKFVGAGKTLHIVRDKRITGALKLAQRTKVRTGIRGCPTKMPVSEIVKIASNSSKNKLALASTLGISNTTASRYCQTVAKCHLTLQETLATWLLSQLEQHPPSFVGDNWIWDETGQSMRVNLEFESVALCAAQGASCWKVFIVRVKVLWGWVSPDGAVKVSGVFRSAPQ